MEIPAQKASNRKFDESLARRMYVGFAIYVAFLLASSANAAVTISPDRPESVQQGILAA